MTSSINRGQFLTVGMRGGLALVAGGSLLAATAGSALGAETGDVAIAKLAATAELLAIDFYGKAIAGGKFSGDQLAYLTAAKQNEQDHYDALATVLASDAPKGLTFTYPDGTFKSAQSIAMTAIALEAAFVGAYMGAIPALSDNGLKKVAAQVGANEAQHLTVLKSVGAGGQLVPNPSLPSRSPRPRRRRPSPRSSGGSHDPRGGCPSGAAATSLPPLGGRRRTGDVLAGHLPVRAIYDGVVIAQDGGSGGSGQIDDHRKHHGG